MKKLKFAIILGLAIVMLLVMTTNVKAEVDTLNWTDSSKIEMSLTKEVPSVRYYDVYLNVKGLEEVGGETQRKYYIYVRNGNTEPTVTKSETGRINNADFDLTTTGIKKFKINDWIGNAGDIYVWIYEEQTNLETQQRSIKVLFQGLN